MKTIGLTAVALLATALVAQAAPTGPWHVETVGPPGQVSRAVDVLPNGRTALLLQRRAGTTRRLELRVGGRTRLLDTSPRGFLDADLQHDARGRFVAVWGRFLEGPTPHVFAWTAAAGKQQISTGSTALPTLAVAPSGRAAIAYGSSDGTFVARGAAARGFEKAESVDHTAGFPTPPGIDVTTKGRIVVAWIDSRKELALRAASPGATFGALQTAALRPRDPGTTNQRDNPKVALTSDGRAVVIVHALTSRGETILDSRVEGVDWAPASGRPSAGAILSRSAAAGLPDVITRGKAALIAWTQQPKGAPRSLWTTRWTTKGIERPNVYDTHALGAPILLTAAPGGAVDAFYRAGGPRWFTVRLSAAGRYTGTAAVTPPGERVASLDVAAGAHTAAVWTVGRPPRQIRLARPG